MDLSVSYLGRFILLVRQSKKGRRLYTVAGALTVGEQPRQKIACLHDRALAQLSYLAPGDSAVGCHVGGQGAKTRAPFRSVCPALRSYQPTVLRRPGSPDVTESFEFV